ncbi:hypothetical protein DACRYDRAFT_116148 [Dacryopinax primogenitus]|uniref:CBS domain-containing protein n=1 Tax=Dacryopinax primogenitus (strain DJM 731) TaxID=1858805 RepID=M5G2M8_DACPD|nr:uncharacterized protein DACRYDRAFT_116148 [Dacryopinax primogenitus]EJU02470.1 hypothetical protein DACRYDRAFT_116148 [Dacryopinax primogenitus]
MSHIRRNSSVRFPPSPASLRSPSLPLADLPPSPQQPSSKFQEYLVSSPLRAIHLIDEPAVVVSGDAAVEDACAELLKAGPGACLVVQSSDAEGVHQDGLFDYADANSFLLLGLNARSLSSPTDPRVSQIILASRQGVVPIRLACNISQKNPMEVREEDASLETLLQIYSTGTHRVVIQPQPPTQPPKGLATDLSLISHLLHTPDPSVHSLLSLPLQSLLPDPPNPVIATSTDSTILDAMTLMDSEGVNSVAVLDANGNLHSAVSVTDIGRLVIPSLSKDVLSTKLGEFVQRIKWSAGETDGRDHFPVYSVLTSSTLEYMMEKLVATKAHRLFLVDDPLVPTSPSRYGNLRGVVSVVDILSIFARLAGLPDVDPFHLRRKRRTSSTSSLSSTHSRSSLGLLGTGGSSVTSLGEGGGGK